MKLNLVKSLGFLAIAALVSTGCSKTESGPGQPSSENPRLSGQEYKVISGDLKSSADAVEGTGALVFRLPLPDEDNNYNLTFDLKEGSEVTLVSQADASLSTGIQFMFFRKNGKLEGRIIDGAKDTVVTEDMPTLSATATVNAVLDIHGHGHIIFFDGDAESQFEFLSRPTGKFWGLKLKDASVKGAVLSKPKHED